MSSLLYRSSSPATKTGQSKSYTRDRGGGGEIKIKNPKQVLPPQPVSIPTTLPAKRKTVRAQAIPSKTNAGAEKKQKHRKKKEENQQGRTQNNAPHQSKRKSRSSEIKKTDKALHFLILPPVGFFPVQYSNIAGTDKIPTTHHDLAEASPSSVKKAQEKHQRSNDTRILGPT